MMVSRELLPFCAGIVAFFALSLEIGCRRKGCCMPSYVIRNCSFVNSSIYADFCARNYLRAPNRILEGRGHGKVACYQHRTKVCMSCAGFGCFDRAASDCRAFLRAKDGKLHWCTLRDNPDVCNGHRSLNFFPRCTSSSALHTTSVKQK